MSALTQNPATGQAHTQYLEIVLQPDVPVAFVYRNLLAGNAEVDIRNMPQHRFTQRRFEPLLCGKRPERMSRAREIVGHEVRRLSVYLVEPPQDRALEAIEIARELQQEGAIHVLGSTGFQIRTAA